MTDLPINSFVVLGCGAVAIAGGTTLYRRLDLLRRWLIPAPIVAGLLLAAPTLVLRACGVSLNVDPTLQQLTMVMLFTSIGFNLDREALRRGGRPVLILLAMFGLGAFLQNVLGVALARSLGLHPLLGIATGAVAFAGGPATSLAFGPVLEEAGARGATSVALASSIAGILIAGLSTGAFGAFLVRRNRLEPGAARTPESGSAPPDGGLRDLPRTILLFGAAMGLGHLLNLGLDRWLRVYSISMPAYVGAMIVAAAMRWVAGPRLRVGAECNAALGLLALSWFIPLALWTLRYWELAGLAAPVVVILAAQLPLTAVWCWLAYRLLGRSLDSAQEAGAFFGFMFGTMANSFAALEEYGRRFGPSPQAFLVISLAGGVVSDLINVAVIVLSKVLLA